MVSFIEVLKFDILNGNKRATSISKIKNRIMIKKNCIEKDGIEAVCDKKPHSKVLHFCSVVSMFNLTNLIKIINNKTINNLINTVVNIVIMF